MAHLTSLKAFRATVAGVALLAALSPVEAGLNIMGMPMAVHPLGDTMDFSMGGLKVKRDCDDDDLIELDVGVDIEIGGGSPSSCLDVKPSAWTLSNMYRDQPLFMNFRPRTEEAMLIDNMCFTFFPLPDDQFTYVMYTSTVYRDGSNLIESDIVTDVQLGIFRAASPYCTFKDHVLGYAGCDTFVMYRCALSSECRNKNAMFTFGLSQSCRQISISCLQKIEDIIQSNGIPEQDYVALPMKLPTQCIFEPVCTFKGEAILDVYEAPIEIIAPITPIVDYYYEEEFVGVPLLDEYATVIPEPFYGGYGGYGYGNYPYRSGGYYGYY